MTRRRGLFLDHWPTRLWEEIFHRLRFGAETHPGKGVLRFQEEVVIHRKVFHTVQKSSFSKKANALTVLPFSWMAVSSSTLQNFWESEERRTVSRRVVIIHPLHYIILCAQSSRVSASQHSLAVIFYVANDRQNLIWESWQMIQTNKEPSNSTESAEVLGFGRWPDSHTPLNHLSPPMPFQIKGCSLLSRN